MRTDLFSPQRPFFSRLEGAGLALRMHAWIPWPCLPMPPPYWADIGSQYRISGAIRFRLFPAPWVLGYIAGQSAVPQYHCTTGYVSSSAALRPTITFVHSRSKRHWPSSAPPVPLHPSWRRLTRRPRPRDENVLPQRSNPDARPPTPTLTSKFEAGGFNQLPFLGLVLNASRQMREVFTHRASKLMHGRVLDMSCRDSIQSLTHAGPPGPSRSSR